MQASHLDQVLQIERVSFPTPWSRQAFLSELYHNDFAHYYVCLLDGRVVGYAGMWVILDEAHVTNVAVHPQYRGQQIGQRLLAYLLGEAAGRGAARITLEVRPSNQPAQHLYQKLGFKPVGVRKGYYTDTHEDAIIMWRRLDHRRTRAGAEEGPSPEESGA
ncbi:MAG: ribosomal protein S18-alanine N-acetyltransferase [Clostridia bacterium]|nr:ribosomal protein S18-alanine N-acetyltransferase [Clostridia bacterium]MBC7346569.1 ribosomal protein S18-alanine N-acetyltransferase [Clostridia bacterium]